MKLLHISLLVVLLLAVMVDGAKKRKNNHRDRDETGTSKQIEDDQLSARKEDESILKQKENKKKERDEKEEKPLKKAEDESSSSEEEDEKKDKENKTTIAPSRKRREHDSRDGQIYADIDRYDHMRNYRDADSTLKKAKELDHLPMNTPDIEHRSGRSRRAENTMHRAKELDHLPMGNTANQQTENAVRHRPRRAENTHAQTGEVVLSRAQELNDGERTPLVIDEKAGSRPDYRRKSSSRKRRNGEFVLEKAQELNGGERTEIAIKDITATSPDYRKNSRSRRTLERHFNRARRTLDATSKSDEDTLKKATELNDGERRPVDKLPSQSNMPEKVKAHKRRAVRHLNTRHQPGNQEDSRDTEEWKLENEEDYDDGGNS